jgi:hypothetical protein
MKDCLLINEFDSETGARSHRSLPPVATREVNDGSLTSRPSSTPASSSSSQVIATGTTDGTPPPHSTTYQSSNGGWQRGNNDVICIIDGRTQKFVYQPGAGNLS